MTNKIVNLVIHGETINLTSTSYQTIIWVYIHALMLLCAQRATVDVCLEKSRS